MIRKIVGIITLIGFSLFIGCESAEPIVPITFELQLESGIDSNGYYHVSIDTTRWQTIYRISGNVYRTCLFYSSESAADLLCVNLGDRTTLNTTTKN